MEGPVCSPWDDPASTWAQAKAVLTAAIFVGAASGMWTSIVIFTLKSLQSTNVSTNVPTKIPKNDDAVVNFDFTEDDANVPLGLFFAGATTLSAFGLSERTYNDALAIHEDAFGDGDLTQPACYPGFRGVQCFKDAFVRVQLYHFAQDEDGRSMSVRDLLSWYAEKAALFQGSECLIQVPSRGNLLEYAKSFGVNELLSCGM